jgi:P-type E1-E2 ATPase
MFLVIRSGKRLSVPSAKIQTGDIVRTVPNPQVCVQRDQRIPADLVLLHADDGCCYVETSELDGESNLKRHLVPAELQQRIRSPMV